MKFDLKKGNMKLNFISLLLLLTLVISNQSAFAAKIFRWTDAKGNLRFSDTVPPDQVSQGREELNKSARVVEVVKKAKTKSTMGFGKKTESFT